jgi:hypothetical protein
MDQRAATDPTVLFEIQPGLLPSLLFLHPSVNANLTLALDIIQDCTVYAISTEIRDTLTRAIRALGAVGEPLPKGAGPKGTVAAVGGHDLRETPLTG